MSSRKQAITCEELVSAARHTPQSTRVCYFLQRATGLAAADFVRHLLSSNSIQCSFTINFAGLVRSALFDRQHFGEIVVFGWVRFADGPPQPSRLSKRSAVNGPLYSICGSTA
jgi:hypothetical protein